MREPEIAILGELRRVSVVLVEVDQTAQRPLIPGIVATGVLFTATQGVIASEPLSPARIPLPCRRG